MTDTKIYWEERYRTGGNSGAGSYGEYAKFKGDVVNPLLRKYNIKSIVDLGCGDGNQLKYFNLEGIDYIGVDISQTALNKARQQHPKKTFVLYENFPADTPRDLTLSLDVIYHLIEDSLYEAYMKTLFNLASKYVLIFSTNHNQKADPHVLHRRFTDDVPTTFFLQEKVNSPLDSKIFFYLYKNQKIL